MRSPTAAALTIALLACAPAPAASWPAGPDRTAALPGDGGRVDRPAGLTEIDAWLVDAAGRPSLRLRQRPALRCFTRVRARRCLVRYSATSFATGYDTTRHGARVYGWY